MFKMNIQYLINELTSIKVDDNNDINITIKLNSIYALKPVLDYIKQEINIFMNDNKLNDLSVNQKKDELIYIIHV